LRRTLQFLSVLLLASELLAATAELAPPRFLTHVWRADDGLPHNSVVALAQTPDGYLWVGTRHGGLARFDGVRFQVFDPLNTPALSSEEVLSLFADANGTLWINTVNGGITAYREGRFTQVREGTVAPLHWLRFLVATRADGAVFQTQDGWLVQAILPQNGPASWVPIPPPDPEGSGWFCADAEGRYWCRTADAGLARSEGTNWVRLTGDLGLKSETIGIVQTDAQRQVWVGTEREIARWDGSRFEDRTPTNGEPDLRVDKMVFASDGSLWVGANGRLRRCGDRRWLAEAQGWDDRFGQPPHGSHLFGDAQGGAWIIHHGDGVFRAARDGRSVRVGATNGLPNALVECWLEDREQNVWLGLLRGGLVRLRPGVFDVLDADASGAGNYVTSVCTEGGDVWLGTAVGGLARWRAGVPQPLPATLKRELAGSEDVVVAPGQPGQVWVGTLGNGALVLTDGNLERPFPAEAVKHVVRVVFRDQRGAVWLGSEFGLFSWADAKLRRCEEEGFDPGYVLALAEDSSGRLLVGTGEGELRRRTEARWEVFRPDDGQPASRFWALLGDADGSVWIGTLGGGLLRFADGAFQRFTTRHGLPSDTVSQVLDDGRGQLWLGTRAGIAKVAKADLMAVAKGERARAECVTYGRDDGLPTIECSSGGQPAAWHTADGRLWFATANGAVSVQPDAVLVNRLAPTVVIESLLVDGRAQALPRAGTAAPPLHIPPGRHYFEFHFAGLSFTAPDKVRFRWRLEGLETDWVAGGSAHSVSYSFLPPGAYRFRVLACNNDGVWNETGAALAFVVAPFFWQTWAFKLGSGAALLVLFALVIVTVERRKRRQRLAAVERRLALERERSRIARDIHDDLGASLTQITLLSQVAGLKSNEPGRLEHRLGQIFATARDVTRALDEIVWAVNPKHDTLESLGTYLGKFAQDFLSLQAIRCRLDVPVNLADRPVGSQTRHNLFLAFKEALNNAARHAGASEVRIALQLEATTLVVLVQDDGKGFDPDAPPASRRHGLANLRSRLAEVGGRCDIESAAGVGTTVRFSVPLAAAPTT
jgi:signal transduction histidine kinase/ligand-binding sensor domain-containing protein